MNATFAMDSLCTQLDSVLLEYFDAIEQFYQCQETLAQTLKSGNLHMSRARYIRGAVSISESQITEKEMQASVHVRVSDEREGKNETGPTFTLTSESDDSKQPSSDATRRRHTDTENENSSPQAKDESQTGCAIKDPLHWFGLLVPQALRYSQKNYKLAIEQCVELTNLQSRIQQIQKNYENLLHKKNLLALDKLDIS